MADDADLAQARLEREESLRRRWAVPPRAAGPYTGYCYNCGARVPSPRRWCDADCRDDWEKRHVQRMDR